MVKIHETTRTLPYYRPVPLTNLPLIYQREHLFPYTSYGDTATEPVPRTFRMVVLENAALRVEVAPELGGRVYSLFDKRIGKEILFSNPIVKPVRIPPIGGFISGGIEFNFPLVHTPTAIATVGCSTGMSDRYGFVRVGEREARTGMEWVVELGLVADESVLVQRTALRNLTGVNHPWSWWTIAAVPSTTDTEFVFPDGGKWEREFPTMTAHFLNPGSATAFGSFHHDLGFGLMHVADARQLPERKMWTFGHGRDRVWSQATTAGDRAYAEIESSPGNSRQSFTELWMPVHSREECERVELPALELPAMNEPWLRYRHSEWQTEWERFAAGDGPLPASVVPTGLPLDDALRRARANEPLALWLAFHGRPKEALPLVAGNSPWIAGLIEWYGLQNPAAAVRHLEAGPLTDAFAVAKLDELYELLGHTERRRKLLAGAPPHRLIVERRANLALATGNPAEAVRLLSTTTWPRELQRYVRSELWKKARPGSPVPEFLGEVDLSGS